MWECACLESPGQFTSGPGGCPRRLSAVSNSCANTTHTFNKGWQGWGGDSKVQSPGKSKERLGGIGSWDLWHLISSICHLDGEWEIERSLLVYSPGNILGLPPSVRSAWIWDFVLIKFYFVKQLPSSCFFSGCSFQNCFNHIKTRFAIGFQ